MRRIQTVLHFNLICSFIALVGICLPSGLLAQQIDILLKGGHLIDPKNNLNEILDVAISDGKIAAVKKDIDATGAKKTINATGLFIVPGLIDIHTHVFVGPQPRTFANGFSSVSPDDFSFRSGITTMVDAGTSGWRNFEDFKTQIIDRSATRVLAFLNIVGVGMVGSPHEQNV
ncbi:MAG: amidohydrolase/deacetylase family metallohydrolase, partial [Saprospiraceae bacterium]|nr:amidohydrolase/deacetylase family metallohydrolase [Saprospiraceae bacterium]